jgi:hypothetical protein
LAQILNSPLTWIENNNKNEIIINKWGRHYPKAKNIARRKNIYKTKIISGTAEQTFTFYNII